MKKLLTFKNWLDGKTPCTEKLLELKIDSRWKKSYWKIVWIQNWFYQKIACVKKLITLKNYLYWKIVYIENFVYNEK